MDLIKSQQCVVPCVRVGLQQTWWRAASTIWRVERKLPVLSSSPILTVKYLPASKIVAVSNSLQYLAGVYQLFDISTYDERNVHNKQQ